MAKKLSDTECFEVARKRVDYRLGFMYDKSRKIPKLNQFGQIVLVCAGMPNAYDLNDTQVGEWYEEAPDMRTPDESVEALFCAAVAEAVHEVCEWFQINGRPLVDPHSKLGEPAVYNASHVAAETILFETLHKK